MNSFGGKSYHTGEKMIVKEKNQTGFFFQANMRTIFKMFQITDQSIRTINE